MQIEYDGSFQGLMTAIHFVLRECPKSVHIRKGDKTTVSMFDDIISMGSKAAAVSELIDSLKKTGGFSLLQDVMTLFLSENQDFENLMLQYIRIAQDAGKDPAGQKQHPVIHKAQKLIQKVRFEVHRFKGMLRFEQLETNYLWASYEPDHNISCLLAPHFKRRMPHENFVICDVRRGTGVLYDQTDLNEIIFDIDILQTIRQQGTLLKTTDPYARLWKAYFDRIAIRERQNLKLQQSFMPKKYWRYLTEKSR